MSSDVRCRPDITGRGGQFNALVRLIRLSVSCMVAVSAGFGYLLARPVPDMALVLVSVGTFCLAAACSILNQVQERDTDARLSRTRCRPIPMGTVSVPTALLLGVLFVLAAFACLAAIDGRLVWLGLGIVGAYNGVYTPMKRYSGFALLVGSIPGAMPPVMGWIAAGGSVTDPAIVAVFTVYYLWQVPHFWLRVERDRNEYAVIGLPLPVIDFGEQRYRLLLRLWFHAYAAGLVMLPLFVWLHATASSGMLAASPGMRVLLTACVMVLFLVPGGLLLHNGKHARAFHWVNASLLVVMVLLLADRLLLS